ncbi:hypothetical protein N0V88_006172 [Collariella sp. IMI 366227]|nr:hypothetical protein N0V88_006172 [Collariella sp. IMI 366227]
MAPNPEKNGTRFNNDSVAETLNGGNTDYLNKSVDGDKARFLRSADGSQNRRCKRCKNLGHHKRVCPSIFLDNDLEITSLTTHTSPALTVAALAVFKVTRGFKVTTDDNNDNSAANDDDKTQNTDPEGKIQSRVCMCAALNRLARQAARVGEKIMRLAEEAAQISEELVEEVVSSGNDDGSAVD